jgi:hypothetical protein
MATGTQTWEGGAVPLYGESTITGNVVGTTILTLKEPASATAAPFEILNSADTRMFAIAPSGRVLMRVFTTRPTTGLTKGELMVLFHVSTPKLGVCISTAGQAIKLIRLRTKTFGRLTA